MNSLINIFADILSNCFPYACLIVNRKTQTAISISHRWKSILMKFCFVFTQHTFVGQPGLSRALAVELLDKVNNPDNHTHYTEGDDDDFEVRHVCSLIFVSTGLIHV